MANEVFCTPIIIVSDFCIINGGAAKVAILDAIGLSDAGNRVIFFSGDNNKPCDELISRNIEVINVGNQDLISRSKLSGLTQGFYSKRTYNSFLTLLRRLGKDVVVHIHSWTKTLTFAIYKALVKEPRRVFLTTHDYFLICPNGGLFNYRKKKVCPTKTCRNKAKCLLCSCDKSSYVIKIWRWLRFVRQDRLIKRVKPTLLTLSDDMKQRFADYSPKPYHQPRDIVWNPRPKRTRIDQRDPKSFIFVGRNSVEKGLDRLIAAAKKAGAPLLIVGPKPDGEEGQVNTIKYFGWASSDDMETLWPTAKALIFPSIWFEGDALVPFEAMAHGVPVIMNSVCNGTSNIVPGKNGFVYKDEEELLHILAMLSSPERLAPLFQGTEEEYIPFSLSQHIARLMDIYHGESA